MAMVVCPCCSELRPDALPSCPHCSGVGLPSVSPAAAAMLGLTLVVGCGKKEDSGSTTTTGTTSAQALYGAPLTGSMSRSEDVRDELAAELVKSRGGTLTHPED